MGIRVYRRKARHSIYSRRCLHWEHIKKRQGVVGKIIYITNRLQGLITPSSLYIPDWCIHKGDGETYHTYPMQRTA